MNNKYVRVLAVVLVVIALFGILAGLYWKSQAFGIAEQAEIRHDLRTAEALDTEWSLDIWRDKDGMSKSYAKGASPKEKLLALNAELSGDFVNLGSQAIIQFSAQLGKMLSEKVSLVDALNEQTVKNRALIKTIPAETSELIAMNKALQMQGISAKFSERIDSINAHLETLMVSVFKFDTQASDEAKEQIVASLDLLTLQNEFLPKAVALKLTTLTADAQSILAGEIAAHNYIDSINKLSVSQFTQKIDAILNDEYNAQLTKQAIYRNALFAYAILLITLIGIVASRLFKSLHDVKHANATLENKVNERTAELSKTLATLKESQLQLVQSEKMSMLGQMVAGVTHEINTPLGYVKSGLQTSRSRIPEMAELVGEVTFLSDLIESGHADESVLAAQLQKVHVLAHQMTDTQLVTELDDLMKDGLDGLQHISEIITSLKNFSRIDRAKVTQYDIHEGLDSTLKIATSVVRHKRVVKQYGSVSRVTCAPSSINQVFLNLVSNAAQATGDDGEIRISTSMDTNGFVVVEISDNGTGIPDEHLAKIFEPFFTTKTEQEGTGLGLSICKRIIDEHGGNIKVQTRMGFGTKFTVSLPQKLAAA